MPELKNQRSALWRAVTLALAVPAFAAPAAAQDDAEALETITVVGSRIKRTDIETSQPVFVLEREDLQKTGLTSIGDILQDLTTGGAALNTVFNNGGNGSSNVSLRNLGANRTLVLVNGRRWTTTLGGAVDLTTIPVSVVERVEVLKDGASAIYGSDAVGGVINITTRDTYDGGETGVYYGENEEGDGETEHYDFTIGSSTDRASIVANISYDKQEAIFAGDREISRVPLFGFGGNNVSAGASSTTPYGRFGFGTGAQLPNGASGTLTLVPGRTGTSASDYQAFNAGTDGFNFAPDNYLLTPSEKIGVFVQARYQLTDDVSFRTVVLYSERRSEQQLAAIPFTFGTSGTSAITRSTVISAQNVYNPFGVDVTRAQYRNTRVLRNFNQDVDTFYFSGALEGGFDIGDRNFSWDAGYIFSDSERRDVTFGQFDSNRLRQGLGPSFIDANGVARCGTPAAIIAGCVPINLFGGPDGFTQAMGDYAAIQIKDDRYKKLYNYTANVTGDLFDLPAGPLGFAAGYEYRREFGFDQPDSLVASGGTTGNNRSATQGGFSLDEFYTELNIPILADAPFAEVVEVSLAGRYSDYSNFGDTTNLKFGFRWKPHADLLVRGNYAEGFRAPTIAELFLGQSDSFATLSDPCSASSNPTGAVLERCRDGFAGIAGVPPGYEQVNTQIRVTVGGNPEVQPETSTNKTLGLVYSPSWLEGLDLYLDWYNIEIENVIGAPAGQTVLNTCYQNGNLASCGLISRDSTGNIANIALTTQNNGQLYGVEVEGYDLTVSYRFDTDFGRFQTTWDNAYVSYLGDLDRPDNLDPLPNGAIANGNNPSLYGGTAAFLTGLSGQWRLRSNLTTSWTRGDFGASVTARYLSRMEELCTTVIQSANAVNQPQLAEELCGPGFDDNDPQVGGPVHEIDDVWYFDVQGTWDAPWNARVTAGIRNLLDEDPPVIFTATNSFDPAYDVPGRYWYVQYTQRF